MIFLDLFISFLKIGFTSFGGMSMLPLISQEMLDHGWLSSQELSDLVAIAEMTPGPLAVNCATFAGMRTAGIGGALIANLGILFPTLTLCMAAAIFFERFRKSSTMTRIMIGVRPACGGLILGVLVSLLADNYFPQGTLDVPSIAIGLLDFFLLMKCKKSVPFIICVNALCGIFLFGF